MDVLMGHGLVNWMSVVRGTSDSLFTALCDTSVATLKEHHVEHALAESVFNHAKESPGYDWSPENGKFYIFTTLIVLTCGSGMGQWIGVENDVQRSKFQEENHGDPI